MVAVRPSLFLIVTLIQILSCYYQSVTLKSDQRVTGNNKVGLPLPDFIQRLPEMLKPNIIAIEKAM